MSENQKLIAFNSPFVPFGRLRNQLDWIAVLINPPIRIFFFARLIRPFTSAVTALRLDLCGLFAAAPFGGVAHEFDVNFVSAAVGALSFFVALKRLPEGLEFIVGVVFLRGCHTPSVRASFHKESKPQPCSAMEKFTVLRRGRFQKI